MKKEYVFQDRASLNLALTQRIAECLRTALAARGSATFLVSGGSSPRKVYEALARVELDWSRVTVALVDERWVDTDDQASNEAFIRNHLLQGFAAKASFVGMKTSAATVWDGLAECEARYASLSEQPDICLLGMGSDGHTASFFPHASGLEQALALPGLGIAPRCVAIEAIASEVTGEHTQRMTVSLSYLSTVRERVLLINGEAKRETLRLAEAVGERSAMPVRALLDWPLDVYWSP